jgi:3-hydroxyanthranilate 3,4-dioxygenase
MAELEPVHLMRWIDANRTLFAPPVANKEVFPESEFIYQIVRGPNARNDFHIDPGDEIFYQLRGDITVRCREADGRTRDVPVREGEAMLVRAGTPHCPIRPTGTWGSSASAVPRSSTRWPGSASAAAPCSTKSTSPAPTSSAS